MKKILIIEDDYSIAMLQKDYLEANGYEVTVIQDGEEGLKEACKNPYNLIVLDVMLPSMDGFLICKNIRSKMDIPILMITAKSSEIDKVRGLGLGADDYITKPFSLNEFVARVASHISRFERLTGGGIKNNKDILSIRGLVIDLDAHRVYLNDKEIFLANKEFELLSFLAQNPNKVFSKDKLLDCIWGYGNFAENATVTVHIKRIREKIETESTPQFIETVWGAGYRFCI